MRSWIARGPAPVVTTDRFDDDRAHLLARISQLERTVHTWRAIGRLLWTVLRLVAPPHPLRNRHLTGADIPRIQRAIDAARAPLGLARVLRFLGVSPSRHHAWRHTPCDSTAP